MKYGIVLAVLFGVLGLATWLQYEPPYYEQIRVATVEKNYLTAEEAENMDIDADEVKGLYGDNPGYCGTLSYEGLTVKFAAYTLDTLVLVIRGKIGYDAVCNPDTEKGKTEKDLILTEYELSKISKELKSMLR